MTPSNIPFETADDVLRFWFEETPPELWFEKNDAFDATIVARGMVLHERAAAGGLSAWRDSADGALAEIITLDQFPRNMFRESPRSYATDPLARECAEAALARGFDQALEPVQRPFMYLPLQHSEDPADQERQVALFEAHGNADSLKWAVHHKVIVDRFGRFPHRNALLGRESTPEELAFLKEPNSSF